MRTLEEVKKHLESVCYNDEADKFAIIGFLLGKGLLKGESGEIDFASPEENTFVDFIEWFDNKEEKEEKREIDSEIEEALKELEGLVNCTTDPKLKKVGSCFLEFAKELQEVEKQINA